MASSRRRAKRDPLPRFPVAPVIVELTGCDPADIPTGFGWVRMACPFHDDRSPSAAVNHDLQGFECKGCGVKGDAIKLLQTQANLPFREALAKAQYLSGDEVTGTSQSSQPARKRRPSDLFRS